MEQTAKKLKAQLKLLRKSLASLEAALRQPPSDFMRDSAIQRFEYVFEMSWKTLQTALRFVGADARNPREALRRGYEMGWLKKPRAWLSALEQRNLTSHTYDEHLAKNVYRKIKSFPPLVHRMLLALSRLK